LKFNSWPVASAPLNRVSLLKAGKTKVIFLYATHYPDKLLVYKSEFVSEFSFQRE
jgi:hypothetical protein